MATGSLVSLVVYGIVVACSASSHHTNHNELKPHALVNPGFLQSPTHGAAVEHEQGRPILLLGGSVALLVALAAMGYAIKKQMNEAEAKETVQGYLAVFGCFCGICISFVFYGIVQEYIMTHEYTHGGHFPSVPFLVLCNRSFGVLVLSIILGYRREAFFPDGSQWCSIPAITLFISTMCQHSSLRYVSFPVQLAFKSGKVIPTMVIGTTMLGRRFTVKDYIVAALITSCVIGFSMAVEDFSSHGAQSTKFIGVAMMMVFLFCDALTSNGEKKIFEAYPQMVTFQMMFVMALFSVLYSIVTIAGTGNVATLLTFLKQNPVVLIHIAGLSISAVCGQLFVFHTIRTYGPVVFSIMMTIRMVVSMTTSAILFGHQMTMFAQICALALFAVLFGDAYLKFQEKKAKGSTNEKH